ncbi:hypothetical protein PMAYCL1PPCAC_00763, partial [Pristionchus mayeri]
QIIQMASLFSACLPPFRACLDCVQGPSFANSQNYAQFRNEQPTGVRLDVSHMGKEVVILKEGERICGTGGCIANAPLVQSKAYFQVNVQQTGKWGVGLAARDADMNAVPTGAHFWGIDELGRLVGNKEEAGKYEKEIEEGDSLGICYDHVELSFYHNGERLPHTITNVKGKVFPCIYVDDSAILDVKFRSFSFPAPAGFSEILIEQTLL